VQVKSTDRYLPGIVLVVAVGAAAAVAVRLRSSRLRGRLGRQAERHGSR
jgi:hypothetical protein